MSYDTKPQKKSKKKKKSHHMHKACDEAGSRIGKFIFGNQGFQMEYFPVLYQADMIMTQAKHGSH